MPIGLIGGAAGIGLMFGGFFINTQVAPLHEMREMADVYNNRLREELGVQPSQTPPNTTMPVQQVRLMPSVGSSLAGLTLGGRF